MSLLKEDLLITLLIAVYIVAASIIGAEEFKDDVADEIHAKQVAEKKEMHPCDFTAIEYGYYHTRREPECIGKGGPLPNHVLTLPVGQ